MNFAKNIIDIIYKKLYVNYYWTSHKSIYNLLLEILWQIRPIPKVLSKNYLFRQSGRNTLKQSFNIVALATMYFR